MTAADSLSAREPREPRRADKIWPAMRSAPTVLWLLALGFALGVLIALS